MRSSHQPVARICATQSREVFQSSMTSWSSKIIAVGTVDSSQRTGGLAPRVAVQAAVLLEVGDLQPGRDVDVATGADELLRSAGATSSA